MGPKSKLFVGIIHNNKRFPQEKRLELKQQLTGQFGEIDLESKPYSFDTTNYYEEEMGIDLYRIFYSFKELISPEKLTEAKLFTKKIEESHGADAKRVINIDPGYIDFYKLVLASFKHGGQKLYVGNEIYHDIVLLYDKGWKPFLWTFPDFKGGRYNEVFDEIRLKYKQQLNRA